MYYLSLLGIFKNEADGMKEWLDHYIWQGVEHFFIINNGSTDNYLEVLEPYIKNNIVTVYDRFERHVQEKHYNEIYNLVKNETKWLIVADFDEFWYAYPDENIVTVLKKYENHSAIMTNWQFFGSSGFIEEPDGIRENFIMKWKHNGHMKGIVQTEYTTCIGIHSHSTSRLLQKVLQDELYINHYGIRSKERFKIKTARGNVNAHPYNGTPEERDAHYKEQYFFDHDKNEVEDTVLRDLVRKHNLKQ